MIAVERERQLSNRTRADVSPEYRLNNGINILLGYCKVCKKVGEVLKAHGSGYLSEGLNNLSRVVFDYVENENFYKLEKNLLALKKCTKGYIRLKLGARLDKSFKIKEAKLLDVDSNGFVSKILDKDEYIKEYFVRGLKKLIKVRRKNKGSYFIKDIDYILEENGEEIKSKILSNLSYILEAMITNISSFLRNISDEILFYEGAVKLMQKMKYLGLITSRAKIVPMEERTLIADGLYDLSFALYLSGKGSLNPLERIVTNDIFIKGEEKIQIITGPNQGGKTTYIRAMGILQVLAQAGIPVPALNVAISPVDRIFTHFPVEERSESNEGRLGEELGRMLTIVENATENSLVLINEAFASTNSKEGSKIAQDILSAFAVIGTRCSFVTHLYELANKVDSINKELEGLEVKSNRLISMAAQYEDGQNDSMVGSDDEIRKRTYRIIPGSPSKSSFAADIAAQFGIRYMDFIQKSS